MNKSRVLAWLKSRRVAVLKGGWSRERSISLKTGAAVESAFRHLGVKAVSIDVKPNITRDLRRKKIDFCFIALHGAFGEDGRLQRALDGLKILYTGSGSKASALAMDKILSKKKFVAKNVATPDWVIVKRRESAGKVQNFLKRGPVFVKPSDQGSAIGASPAKNPQELKRALKTSFRFGKTALVERQIVGRELTVGILGKTALPVVEIIPEHSFYDFHSKYAAGGSRHVVPARLSKQDTRAAQKMSLRAFAALGCSAYGRIDLMRDARGKMFVLEVNTIPGMTKTSLLPDAARAAQLSFDDLVLKIVEHSIHE